MTNPTAQFLIEKWREYQNETLDSVMGSRHCVLINFNGFMEWLENHQPKDPKTPVSKAIRYLQALSPVPLMDIRLEEIGENRVVLGYAKTDGIWSDRILKEFLFEKGEVKAMKNFNQ